MLKLGFDSIRPIEQGDQVQENFRARKTVNQSGDGLMIAMTKVFF